MTDDLVAGKPARSDHPAPSLLKRIGALLIPGLRIQPPTLRESLEDVIEEHVDDVAALTADERLMLMNIVTLREKDIDDVMVPRADIVAVEVSVPFPDLVNIFEKAAHSRLPVYRDSLDDVVGMVHIKDVLAVLANDEQAAAPPSVLGIKRPVLFVPPTMPVIDLLLKMRLNRLHMALVVDEFGGTNGLVTIEDLIEEIVGEIEDEHDVQGTPLIVERAGGELEVDARALIADLEVKLDVALLPGDRDEVVDSVGGLVFSLAGRVPRRGEIIRHSEGIEFEVLEADPRRLKRLRVRAPGRAESE